ncbi:MAG: hypothetical protein IPK44_06225 [Candidatus Accumulibacter sp.]|uniref:hypothetical protein n=1 Tax=Accumulibacter sp. TaxID=2053492 RepID=UPI00258A2E2C|nr:hypothetical protein [Accumulibacter sp.]MBK8114155.1 hypothetical protein [Accumulibacter sp.]
MAWAQNARIVCQDNGQAIAAEMIVLMRPVVPGEGTGKIAEVMNSIPMQAAAEPGCIRFPLPAPAT